MPNPRLAPVGVFLLSALVLAAPAAVAADAAADGSVVPLSPEIARDLAVFGEGVVGKPVPALPLGDFEKFLGVGSGQWAYKIISGKQGDKVRTESYTPISDPQGGKGWKREIGEEYNEYLRIHSDGSFVKYAEDDVDVGYGAAMDPGVLLPAGMKPGATEVVHSQIKAYAMGKPDEVKYTGKSTTTLTYVGAYEVTTPAGTWPAVLIRNEFDVDVGPAKVKDVMYTFFAEGVGKIAEIEALNVSAMFVYHSNDKTVKVLAEVPTRSQ